VDLFVGRTACPSQEGRSEAGADRERREERMLRVVREA
jgi:hypothetical protein